MLVGALLGCLGAALTGSSAMGALLAIAGGFAMALILLFYHYPAFQSDRSRNCL